MGGFTEGEPGEGGFFFGRGLRTYTGKLCTFAHAQSDEL